MSEGICRVRKHEVNLATLLKLKTCTVSAEVKLTIFILLPSKLVHSYRKEFPHGEEYFLDENTFWKVFICHGRKQEVWKLFNRQCLQTKTNLAKTQINLDIQLDLPEPSLCVCALK